MDLNYTTNFTTIWDSIEQVIRVKDSVWRSENSEPPHIFEPPLQRPPNRASFTGGNERFYEYVKNRIMVCNLLLKEVKKTKKYTFQFRVNQQGNIDEANVTEGLNSRFSTEVKNILLQSPKWIPSLINGKFINTEYKFTISIVVAH